VGGWQKGKKQGQNTSRGFQSAHVASGRNESVVGAPEKVEKAVGKNNA
jgi:hypothetical protein